MNFSAVAIKCYASPVEEKIYVFSIPMQLIEIRDFNVHCEAIDTVNMGDFAMVPVGIVNVRSYALIKSNVFRINKLELNLQIKYLSIFSCKSLILRF